jgi:hypothetical protein
MDKAKLGAAAKMAWGAFRVAGGIATATGHGTLGAFCRNHHQMRVAAAIAKGSIQNGVKSFREGLDDWNRANS